MTYLLALLLALLGPVVYGGDGGQPPFGLCSNFDAVYASFVGYNPRKAPVLVRAEAVPEPGGSVEAPAPTAIVPTATPAPIPTPVPVECGWEQTSQESGVETDGTAVPSQPPDDATHRYRMNVWITFDNGVTYWNWELYTSEWICR